MPTPIRLAASDLDDIERIHNALWRIRPQYLIGLSFGITTLVVNFGLLLSAARQPRLNIAMGLLGLFAIVVGWRARRIDRCLHKQLALLIERVGVASSTAKGAR